MKRQRGRNRNKKSGGNSTNPNRSWDSNGPEVKVRGNAQTVFERYQQLARDAQSSGNRVRAENLLQHAEHYLRLNAELQAAAEKAREERDARRDKERAERGDGGRGDSDGDDNRGRNRRRRRDGDDDAGEGNRASDASDDTSDDTEDSGRRRRAPRKKDDTTADGLETITPEGDSEGGSTRRRRAPKREESVDAAE